MWSCIGNVFCSNGKIHQRFKLSSSLQSPCLCIILKTVTRESTWVIGMSNSNAVAKRLETEIVYYVIYAIKNMHSLYSNLLQGKQNKKYLYVYQNGKSR